MVRVEQDLGDFAVIGQEIVTTLGITAKEQVSADVVQQDGW